MTAIEIKYLDRKMEEGAHREEERKIQGPSRVERGLVRHHAGVVSVATYTRTLPTHLPTCLSIAF